MSNLFDSHLHFDGLTHEGGPEAAIERALAAGVTRMIAIGGDDPCNDYAIKTAASHSEHVRATVGYDRGQAGAPYRMDGLRELLDSQSGVVAIGETGLDYHHDADTADAQKALLSDMLSLARDYRLPVVIHSREADEDTERMLSEHAAAWEGASDRIGVLHCYTRGVAFAERLLAAGYFISLSGIVSFASADALREVARMVPENRLLIETDAPYLAPIPMRGKRNEPAFVRHVAECVAQVRGRTVEEIAELTWQNGSRLFGWE
jgi:TatD DNase family protein